MQNTSCLIARPQVPISLVIPDKAPEIDESEQSGTSEQVVPLIVAEANEEEEEMIANL